MQRETIESMMGSNISRCYKSSADIDALKYQSEEEREAAKLLAEHDFNDMALRHLWDSARFMLDGFLAQQGLAVTATGDKHKVTIVANEATALGSSIPAVLKQLNTLRARRNELAYPSEDTQPALRKEVDFYTGIVNGLHSKFEEVLETLRVYS